MLLVVAMDYSQTVHGQIILVVVKQRFALLKQRRQSARANNLHRRIALGPDTRANLADQPDIGLLWP